nr:hypothetical protein [Alteripontixanthobacter maritimus]
MAGLIEAAPAGKVFAAQFFDRQVTDDLIIKAAHREMRSLKAVLALM